MIAALLLVLSAFVADDELVAEFQRYYGKDREPHQRREAVLNLADTDSLAAVQALVVVLEDEEYLVRRAAVDILAGYRTEAGARWLVDDVLLDRKMSKKELVVLGVAEALGGMQHGFAREPLVGLLGHRALEVRLGALAGLTRLEDAGAVGPLAAIVTDPAENPVVVIAALGALSAIGPTIDSEAAVLVALGHKSKQVRLKAVAAVFELGLKSGVRPLIMMLGDDPDPRVSEDAYQVLKALTLLQFADEMTTWLSWWDRNESRFELPDLEKVAAAMELIAREGTKYTTGSTSFEDIETKSDHIVFVIDVSQSMSEPFGDPDRLARSGRTYKSLQRLEIVKEELINTIESLPETTNFNIVAYATDVDIWKKKAARATILNRNNAKAWITRLKPRGGQAANFRARMGHIDNQSGEGRTNTHLALMSAFGEDVDKRKHSAFVTKITDPVDTIFFLTDGEPTVGKSVDMVEIREEVRRVNTYRGVQIHVIYVGAYGGDEFKKLANQNGGVFVSIGG